PLARRKRYADSLGLSFKEADALTQDTATGDLLEEAVKGGADVKRCVNLLLGRGSAIANERGCAIAEIGITAGQLGELAKMLQADEVNATAAAKIFDIMAATGTAPKKIAEAEGLLAVTDAGQIEAWVDEAIAANPAAVEDVKSGGKKQQKAFGFLMGRVMQKSRGAAQPDQVRRLLSKKLEG
ncbi:MAG: Asp-tRNA(Asn)/Glu-tRNA(Gln) amidotransferase subunit GatB, partial [Planctomycetota bacterium]